MPKISYGHFIENTDPKDDLQARIEKAYTEYMQKETVPPDVAMVHAVLLKDETTITVDGHVITVIVGPIERWITWIGESDQRQGASAHKVPVQGECRPHERSAISEIPHD